MPQRHMLRWRTPTEPWDPLTRISPPACRRHEKNGSATSPRQVMVVVTVVWLVAAAVRAQEQVPLVAPIPRNPSHHGVPEATGLEKCPSTSVEWVRLACLQVAHEHGGWLCACQSRWLLEINEM